MNVSMKSNGLAEITGLDINNIDDADAHALRSIFHESTVTVVRGVRLSPNEQIEVTRLLGKADVHHIETYRHADYPEIVVIQTLPDADMSEQEGEQLAGITPYHADLSFQPCPSPGSLLHPVVLPPEGGNTEYIDMSAVYEALPDSLKERIAGLTAVHSFEGTREAYDKDPRVMLRRMEVSEEQYRDSAVQPLAFRHPVSGVPILYLSPLFIRQIIGLSKEASDQLIGELTEFAIQERFAYLHEWKQDDLVMWNNLRALHSGRGCKKKYKRELYRTQVTGEYGLMQHMI